MKNLPDECVNLVATATHGSLFTGIGGFDLGLERAGWACQWQVEIDVKCNDVLGHHWPDVKRMEDICDVGRNNLEPADLISGGFPCQDLSVAGKRKGLAGKRSGLWYEFHRVLAELKPQWVIIENVPGLLSSNEGRDFATILQGLAEIGYLSAWRILDAQYFGVAQRRRRVFIVGSLGDGRAAEVLFERKGSEGDTPPRREAGKELARDVGAYLKGGSGKRGFPIEFEAGLVSSTLVSPHKQWNSPQGESNLVVAHSVTARQQRYDPTEETMIVHENIGGSVTPDDHARALRGGTSHSYQFVVEKGEGVIAFNPQSGGNVRLGISHECAPALQRSQVVAVQENQRGEIRAMPYAQLSTAGGKPEQGYPAAAFSADRGGGVRRLTPTECERLQGFPDGWTAVNGQKDSARYRQLGNAVCVPVVEWLGKRLYQVQVGVDGGVFTE